MKIIYVHGLDSSANSVKGQLLEQYCEQYYPDIEVVRPDLNLPPSEVFQKLCNLVDNDRQTVLMGSSLGGYFSSLVSNHTGCAAILLNPSTQPHISLQRFMAGRPADVDKDAVIYQTSGGWSITLEHLNWFVEHKLVQVQYPKRLFVLIKEGDELLDAQIAADFYQSQKADVMVQSGGDHRMTDFESQLPMIMSRLSKLVA